MPPLVAAAAIAAGAQIGTSVYGSKQAGKSARRAADIQSRSDADMMALEARRDEEARRQWDIEEANRASDRAAAEEERAYTRRLQDEREARQAPYRQASASALGNLGQLLGIDMSGTPLNQSLTAPRSMSSGPRPPVSGPMPQPQGTPFDIARPVAPPSPQMPGHMARGSMGELLGLPMYRRPVPEARV